MNVAVIGGGVVGLSLALNLHKRGIECCVYEAAEEVKELGVGITLLPHAMREFAALGLEAPLRALAIENRESCFFNRFGQLIYREPRGLFAGYDHPELGIHRGKLHMALFQAAREALGTEHIVTDRRCIGLEQDEHTTTVHFQVTSTGKRAEAVRADVAIACDGVHSAVRRQFYPEEGFAFAGINTWRGVTRHPPILDGRTYIRIGSIRTGKMVIYPITDDIDDQGNQLINWVAEIQASHATPNDWNKAGRLEDFYPTFENWTFDWLDVARMIRTAELILEYPMVDKDPVQRWTFDRITLAGDAAHPMYPRGSNGAAQGVIDARTLAEKLATIDDPCRALRAYENARLDATARVVRANREMPPDVINIKVEELVGDRPFHNLDDVITQDELRALSDNYKKIAGFGLEEVSRRPPLSS